MFPVMAKNAVSVVMPAFNEENAVSGVISGVKKALKGFTHEIIVVDDASTDRTARAVGKKALLLSHTQNRGYGASIKTGIKKAKHEWILIIDADGSYPTEAIPKLLPFAGTFDMVVGARTGKKVNAPLIRKPAKWFLTKLANYLTGTRIPDLNSGLRLFRNESALKFFSILPNGFSLTSTITIAFLSNDFSVKYVPIDYLKRKGKSKISPIKDTVNFTLLILRAITYFRPLKIFLPVSFVLFVLGFIYALYIGFFRGQLPDSSVLLMVMAVQFFFLGLIADLMSKNRG